MDGIDLGDQVEVQLDVFSGRPNPCWTLASGRVRELERYVEAREPTQGREPPGLGYRGILVTGPSVELRAFDSALAITRNGRTATFRDTGGLERYLLDQASELGFSDLISSMRRERGTATG
jgi:hypothetical protein